MAVTVLITRQALATNFKFYSRRRPHSTLDGMAPNMAYFNLSKLWIKAAA